MREIQIGPPATSFPLDPRFQGHPFSFILHPVTSESVLLEFNGGELALFSLTSGNILAECAARDFSTGMIGHDFSSNLSAGLLVRAVNFWKTPISAIEENSARAEQRFLAGVRIWFCQVCFQRTCKRCGEPTALPSGADVMNEYGEITHAPAFVPPICENRRCEDYRPPPDARMKSSE